MTTRLALALSCLALAACSVAPPPTGGPSRTYVSTASASQTLAADRRNAGIAPLVRNARLDAAAQAHAEFMARTGRTSHVGAGGSRSADRARAAGYCYRALAENIAWGQSSQEAALSGWIASPGHRRHILNGTLRDFGLGNADGYWVMDLGAPC
ncbi:CAP domain-containing protein [Roseisalinus antarcticus]|uniref:Cysteine-rich secretory protein family protein n=1 Tax=Roseisalinus antarcticus TaxID=254357 RepID=A0A1Y5TX81_9RHOB|nr:CAP domain-containing protein [Roseisalinus antarcticus]SLN75995.1 Cysteine-rich secretory protein family protein [Roseisalinus antarcticus]